MMEADSDYAIGLMSHKVFSEIAYTLPEWSRVSDAVAADEKLRNQFGQEVGSALWGGTLLSLERVGGAFLGEASRALFEGADFDGAPDELAFERVYEPLARYLAGGTIHYDVYVPLIGLVCEDAPILLDDKCAIEIAESGHPTWHDLQLALIRADSSRELGAEIKVPDHYKSVLHIQFDAPKLIGPNTRLMEETAKFYADINSRVRDCMRALAVVNFMRIIAWPPQVREVGIGPFDDRGLRLLQPQLVSYFFEAGGTVTKAGAPFLIDVFTRLRHPAFASHDTNRAVRVALDRLAGLGTKPQNIEDQLVDSVIACEAFYTLGHSGYRQELGFRAAMAAARLSPRLNIGAMKQSTVFSIVNQAYNIRSRIVHGSELGRKDLTHEDAPVHLATSTQEVALNYFVWWIAELVRRGISLAIQQTAIGEKIVVDWGSVFFA